MIKQSLRALVLCLLAQTASAESGKVHVVTYLEMKVASSKQAVEMTKQYVGAIRTEAGSEESVALQELGRPERLVILETWRDTHSLEEHENSAQTHAFREHLEAIQRAPADQRITHGFDVETAPTPLPRNGSFVVTHVDVPGPKRSEAEAILTELAAPSRTQKGHVRYDVFQQNDPRMNHFTLFAIWKDHSSFDAYAVSVPTARFREEIAPLLGALYDERIYHVIP